MKKFHRLCEIIFCIAIVNFFLVAFFASILGGDGASGKIEGGHYYLGSHGSYREVAPIIFWFSRYHVNSLLITHPLGMLAGFLYAVTGGGRNPPIIQTYLGPYPKNKAFRLIRRFSWKTVDFIEEIIWLFLDRWRKPDEELFVRRSRKECVHELQRLNETYLSTGQLTKPVVGFFSGKHFSVQKWNDLPLLSRDAGIRTIVTGRFTSTPQGVYVRIWNRLMTGGIAFITFMLGTPLCGLALYGIARIALTHYPGVNLEYVIVLSALVVLPVCYMIILLLTLWISAGDGYNRNRDIVDCVLSALGKSSHSW